MIFLNSIEIILVEASLQLIGENQKCSHLLTVKCLFLLAARALKHCYNQLLR